MSRATISFQDGTRVMNVELPRVIFGSSALANLYERVPEETKLEIVRNWIRYGGPRPVIDSAGKYGAGKALENIGRCLKQLGVASDGVLISNKLGWKRVPLSGAEPTFDVGLWIDCDHDVVQNMSHDGILECYEQGNELLGDYEARLVSIHDPDEYIARARDADEAKLFYRNVLDGYRALDELRRAGRVDGVGIGSKDWQLIRRVFDDGVPLDWVMFANSFTVYRHPPELIEFMERLHAKGVAIINSAVFNAGFLIGGRWFDYRAVTPEEEPDLFAWRDRFFDLCKRHGVAPATACCEFALSPPGVRSLALNTSRPERVAENISTASQHAPEAFWHEMKADGLIAREFPYVP